MPRPSDAELMLQDDQLPGVIGTQKARVVVEDDGSLYDAGTKQHYYKPEMFEDNPNGQIFFTSVYNKRMIFYVDHFCCMKCRELAVFQSPAPERNMEIVPELKVECGGCHQPLKILSYKDGVLTVEKCMQCLQNECDACRDSHGDIRS